MNWRRYAGQTKPVRVKMVIAAVIAAAMAERAHAADIERGEYLASECVTCHQLSGHRTGGIPSIVGLAESHFIEALLAYKSGERDNEVMRTIVGSLTAEDISALAAYFARQGPETK